MLPDALGAAMAAVATCGFTLAAAPLRFRDGMDLQRVTKIEGGAHMTVAFILVDTSLEPSWRSRQKIETAGQPLWVISCEARRNR